MDIIIPLCVPYGVLTTRRIWFPSVAIDLTTLTYFSLPSPPLSLEPPLWCLYPWVCFVSAQNPFYLGRYKQPLFFTVSKAAHLHPMEALAFIYGTPVEFFTAEQMRAQEANEIEIIPAVDKLTSILWDSCGWKEAWSSPRKPQSSDFQFYCFLFLSSSALLSFLSSPLSSLCFILSSFALTFSS